MMNQSRVNIHSFRVVPDLPEAIRPLMEVAQNLWWTWHPEAVELFTRLDARLWESSGHNPVKFLGSCSQRVLDDAARDRNFLDDLAAVRKQMVEETEGSSWFDLYKRTLAPTDSAGAATGPVNFRVAYFCAEFGLTECLQIYSGGLGVLAGDHLKSASELGLPLVAVGLLYRCGYFHQQLTIDGTQRELYPEIDFANQPVSRVQDPRTQRQLRVTVELPGRTVSVGVWRVQVGRVPLLLLDTNMPENAPEDRDITKNLYLGDSELRIKQEIVLGVGGVRALAAVGISASVYHMNEGHSAFLSLERIRVLRDQHKVTFDEAREAAAAGHLFTTHTPLPAGIDRFHPDMIDRYLGPMAPALGLDLEGLLALGRENVADRAEWFSMAVLAIRTSRFTNGVSKLHGHVSRSMWNNIWPAVPNDEVPVGHVTNGIHARSWISPDLLNLYDRYLGPAWRNQQDDPASWAPVDAIPDEYLWAVRQRQREQLVDWCRGKIKEQLEARGAGPAEIDSASDALDPGALTVGFARRFAAYKRGTLILQNKDRLKRLLHSDRPVQFIISGKSHPGDGGGKELIRELVRFTRDELGSKRVVFLEDYSIDIARRMVQGCDVWLNTPRRGLEASGTSGMKAALNGVIHLSILDGWWDEAYETSVGFAIGRGEMYNDSERQMQDEFESRALYDLLEHQVIPEFYGRSRGTETAATQRPAAFAGGTGIPKAWVARMKRCIKSLGHFFNTNRMVGEYARKYYFNLHRAATSYQASELAVARSVASRVDFFRAHWSGVSIESVTPSVAFGASVPLRSDVKVEAVVRLGKLKPQEVAVQLYFGELTAMGDLVHAESVNMELKQELPAAPANGNSSAPAAANGNGNGNGGPRFVYSGAFTPQTSGRRGFAIRVIPRDDRLASPFIPGLITWDGGSTPTTQTQPMEAAIA